VLTAFPLAEIDRVVRRTVIAAIAVAAVAAAIFILLGQPFVAPGLGIGVFLAVVNHRVFQSSALRFTTPDGVVNRKPFAGSVALRLGLCTGVAVALLIFARPVGWGVVAGLALFQGVMLLNAVVSLLRYQRTQMTAPGGGSDG
jgi:hypothetical protein